MANVFGVGYTRRRQVPAAMPRAKLTVGVPEGAWMNEVSTANPGTTFTVVSVLPGTETSVALVRFRSPDLLALLSEMRTHDDVRDAALLWTRGDEALVEVETERPRLLEPLLRAGVPLETPFDVRDARATWELTTSPERLSELGTRLEDRDADYELQAIVDDVGADPRVLTPRQREFLLAAVEHGYYRVPRGITLTDLAAEMGVGKASASDTLARAEERVVEWFLERELPGGVPPAG